MHEGTERKRKESETATATAPTSHEWRRFCSNRRGTGIGIRTETHQEQEDEFQVGALLRSTEESNAKYAVSVFVCLIEMKCLDCLIPYF